MPAGVMDTDKTFTLTVDGVDRVSMLQNGSLRHINNEAGEIDTLSFVLEDIGSIIASIQAWQVVTWTIDGIAYFGGYADDIQPEPDNIHTYPVYKYSCVDYSILTKKSKRVRKSWANTAPGTILSEAFTEAGLAGFDTSTYVSAGTTLETFNGNGDKLDQLLNRLAQQANGTGDSFLWWIDPSKNIHFKSETADDSPFDVVAGESAADWTTVFPVDEMTKRLDASEIRNRITVRGGYTLSDTITDTFNPAAPFVGDLGPAFSLSNQNIKNVISVTENGVILRWGVAYYHDAFGDYDVLINRVSGIIFWPDANDPTGKNVIVQYQVADAVETIITDAASFAKFGLYFDHEIPDATIGSEAEATTVANAMLKDYADEVVSGSFAARRVGLKAGQSVGVEDALLGIAGDYPIRQVINEISKNGLRVLSTVKFGGRLSKLSAYVGGTGGNLADLVTPNITGEVSVINITGQMTALKPGTTFTPPP